MPARIPIDAPTRDGSGQTSSYVVGEGNALVLDPAAQSERLEGAIAERDAGHVAVTHHHPDHVGGVAAYARESDLTVWARLGRTEAFEAATGVAPDRTFGPGDELPAAGGVGVIDTPGHAPEHVAFRTDDAMLTGDLVLAGGSVVVGAPEGDMRAYLSSLRRVYARDPDQLLPAHGPTVDEPRTECERLIEHRRYRERQVRDAVRAGHETPAEIVEGAYEKDVSEVYGLALATVVAHLEKLAVERTIQWSGERARPI